MTGHSMLYQEKCSMSLFNISSDNYQSQFQFPRKYQSYLRDIETSRDLRRQSSNTGRQIVRLRLKSSRKRHYYFTKDRGITYIEGCLFTGFSSYLRSCIFDQERTSPSRFVLVLEASLCQVLTSRLHRDLFLEALACSFFLPLEGIASSPATSSFYVVRMQVQPS